MSLPKKTYKVEPDSELPVLFECRLEVKVLEMSKLSSFIALCAVFGVAWATIGSDLDDDNFRMLKEEDIQNDIQNGIFDDADDSKLFLGGGEKIQASWRSKVIETFVENPEQLPYENFETWDALKSNPPFPDIASDESENEIERVKREGLFSNIFPSKKNKNKMDELIRETPKTADNSKFHGSFMLNDFENDNE